MTRRMRLGIDTGGTFTDFTLVEEDTGAMHVLKYPATPAAPWQSFIEGLKDLLARVAVDAKDITFVCHGTTIATNTVIERKGAKTALLVTEGFRDILNIERLRLPNPCDLMTDRPAPLVPRRLVRAIRGRMAASGGELVPLDTEGAVRAAEFFCDEGVEAVAVCFMNAYRNGDHEQAVKAAASKVLQERFLSLSSEVWPQMREYERTLLTVINAYVGQKMRVYFDALAAGLKECGVGSQLLVTRSNGGVMDSVGARSRPVDTLLSGPASGAVGARYVATQSGYSKIIALDMGGTSADVSIIDGDVPYSTEGSVGDFPIIMPAVEVRSIGAGGGSIAWLDAAGVLKVGPRSAGAKPGPACYGLGGTEPTVSDAYLALGYLDPEAVLGGKVRLDPARARDAIATIARPLGLDVPACAEAILQVATANMYAALLALVAQKGIDPRDFALLPFGGAGPAHGFFLAEEVGMGKVVVPPAPGVLAALGCLVADLRSDWIRAVNMPLVVGDRAVTRAVDAAFADLDRQARDWLRGEGVRGAKGELVHSGDLRYVGQSFELTVPLQSTTPSAEELIDRFQERHERIFGHADRTSPVELINVRTTVLGRMAPVRQPPPRARTPGAPRPIAHRQTFYRGEWVETPVYDRANMAIGGEIRGPAIVQQYDSTSVVPPGFVVHVDDGGNLVGEMVGR